jgi:hypothetical protein
VLVYFDGLIISLRQEVTIHELKRQNNENYFVCPLLFNAKGMCLIIFEIVFENFLYSKSFLLTLSIVNLLSSESLRINTC